jgi:hypothetical protein
MLRESQGEAEAEALAVGEMLGREEIAVGFGEADAGEVGEGGFDGGVGEVVDDGFLREGNAGDVDEGDFKAAAEAAEEGGFAGAGGAGEEEDLAGRCNGELDAGERWRSLSPGIFQSKPFGDKSAV